VTRQIISFASVLLLAASSYACATPPSTSASGTGKIATVLLVTENQEGHGLQARPVDPTTLADFPHYAPLDFGHHYQSAISPDGKTLAVMTWPSGASNSGGVLHLIDPKSLTDQKANLEINDYVNALSFSGDGKSLYWSFPTSHSAAHGLPFDYELRRYNLDSQQLQVIAKFPSSFEPWWNQMQRTASGDQLAVYGLPVGNDGLVKGDPHVFTVDLAKKWIAAEVALAGVKAGAVHEMVQSTDSYKEYAPGLGWDDVRHLLFVVHADEDKITVVDLAQDKIIKQAQIHKQQSLLNQLSSWFILTAEAKGIPTVTRRVVLSHDGQRLYVLSDYSAGGVDQGGALQVIATQDLTEIRRVDRAITDFCLSPDERTLMLVARDPGSAADAENREVYVLDAATLAERAHWTLDHIPYLQGFSPDGQLAYISVGKAKWVEGNGWRDWKVEIQVVNLAAARVVEQREINGPYAAVLTISPSP
jgi:hypothetical protein